MFDQEEEREGLERGVELLEVFGLLDHRWVRGVGSRGAVDGWHVEEEEVAGAGIVELLGAVVVGLH